MDQIIGINSVGLKKLILEIYDYRDKISNILNTSESLIENTTEYYNSLDGIEIRAKFREFSDNFDIFIKNIKSYSDDLEYILSQYQTFLIK